MPMTVYRPSGKLGKLVLAYPAYPPVAYDVIDCKEIEK